MIDGGNMDSTVVLAVVGIIGVIVGTVGTYLMQKITLERQRKWALEDEGRRIKRELISKRLDVIEEAVKIMRNEVGSTLHREMGIPMYDDKDILEAQGKRLQSIRGEAWAALVAFDSKELSENWKAIAQAYSENEETGTVGSDSWNKVHTAYIEIIRLTDEIRSQI